MGRVSTCQKNCKTIDLRGAQVNEWLLVVISVFQLHADSGFLTGTRAQTLVGDVCMADLLTHQYAIDCNISQMLY